MTWVTVFMLFWTNVNILIRVVFDNLSFSQSVPYILAFSACVLKISSVKSKTIVLHQLDQKIIYPHYDFKHLTEKYFEIGMKLDDFLIQLVKYCSRKKRATTPRHCSMHE